MRKGKDITSGGTEFFFSIKYEASATKGVNVPKAISPNNTSGDLVPMLPTKSDREADFETFLQKYCDPSNEKTFKDLKVLIVDGNNNININSVH